MSKLLWESAGDKHGETVVPSLSNLVQNAQELDGFAGFVFGCSGWFHAPFHQVAVDAWLLTNG